MFVDIKLCIVLVGICMVEICEANSYSDYLGNHYDNYAKKLSFYIRKVGDFVYTHPDDESPRKRSFSHTDPDYTYYKPEADDSQSSDSSSCYEELRKCWATKSTDISDDSMSRRIVNILLSRARVREEGSIVRRYIVLETSAADEVRLKKFGLGELKLREIDPILNNGIKSPDGFFEYIVMIYVYIVTLLVNYLLDKKRIVLSIIVFFVLGKTLYKTRWNFRMILFAGIKFLLTISFLISWWKVFQREKGKGTGSPDLPIQCQPDKMRWMDKAMTLFYDYDCDKYNEGQMMKSTSEYTSEDIFVHEIGEALVQTLILNGKVLWWIPTLITDYLPQKLPLIFATLCLFLILLCTISALISLYGFLKEPRKTYAAIEKYVLDLLKNLQTPETPAKYVKLNKLPAKSNTKSGNKHELPDKTNMYYKINCGIKRCVVLKIKEQEKSLEKCELEMKLNSILGKNMEVDKILARITTRVGQQITVTMKRKEDKEELIERWQELRDKGILVEEDIILLNETARWIILGLTGKERVAEESRKICINGETWIWDNDTREWVENKVEVEKKKVEKLENIEGSIKEVSS